MTLEHISYSQLNSYEACPRRWYLSKVAKAEEKQTWYLPIGTAVHNMIEDWLAANPESRVLPPAEDFFFPLIRRQMKIQPDLRQWWYGGPSGAPYTEERALKLVETCFERALGVLEDFEVWEVEYDATGYLPGCEKPIKGFVDIIGEHKKHGPGIIDWKTGMSVPGDKLQLETYSALISESRDKEHGAYFSFDFKGFFVMLNPAARKGALGKPIDLSQVNSGQIGARYQKVLDGINKRDYRANKGSACFSCFFQESCVEFSGPTPQALYYDKAEEDGFPF